MNNTSNIATNITNHIDHNYEDNVIKIIDRTIDTSDRHNDNDNGLIYYNSAYYDKANY